jgi:hypothetical protein
MDQPAIQPPPPSHKPLPAAARPYSFTKATAKAASDKSTAARRGYAALRKQVLRPIASAQSAEEFLTARRLQMLNVQITRTHKLLSDPKSDISHKDRAQLLNALDRLIERERILRGIPAPQNTRENIRTLQVKVQPIISPQPAPRLPANLPEAQPPNVQDVPDLPEPNPDKLPGRP